MGNKGKHGKLMTIGFVFSGMGDFFLYLLLNTYGFIAGLGCFAIAHCFYIASFCTPKPKACIALIRLLPFLPTVGAMFVSILPTAGSLAIPVVLYTLVEVCVAWRAACRIGEEGESMLAQWLGLLGGITFIVSDGI